MNAFLWVAVTLVILGIVAPVLVELVTGADNWSATLQALSFAGACVAVAIVLAVIGVVAESMETVQAMSQHRAEQASGYARPGEAAPK